MKKIIDKFSWYKLAAFLVIGSYAIVSFWMFYPYQPIVIKEPMRIMNQNKTVEAGGTLFYEMDFVKNIGIPGVITKQLINGTVITATPLIGNIKKGNTKKTFSMDVPFFAENGLYKMKWSGTYKVNPLRHITVVAWTEEVYISNPIQDKIVQLPVQEKTQ